MQSLKTYIQNPKIMVLSILRDYGSWIPDKQFVQMMYYLKMGKRLNLNHPVTFNEKLQWLKLYDRKPEYTMMVDKNAVKGYVAEIIGEEHIIPTLGVWDRPEDIDFKELPQQFVLKTTHGGGGNGVVICKDKSAFDSNAAIHLLRKAMNKNIYTNYREWAYKDVKPRIIAEKYLSDTDGELNDYKIFTFNGEPKIIELDYNRFKGHQRNLYDFNWNKIEAVIEYTSDPEIIFKKPDVLEELYRITSILSKGIPHVRVDCYIVDNRIYFGELTFYHGSGFERICPLSYDFQMGDWINLPEKTINR